MSYADICFYGIELFFIAATAFCIHRMRACEARLRSAAFDYGAICGAMAREMFPKAEPETIPALAREFRSGFDKKFKNAPAKI
jgi:hypothetical protein